MVYPILRWVPFVEKDEMAPLDFGSIECYWLLPIPWPSCWEGGTHCSDPANPVGSALFSRFSYNCQCLPCSSPRNVTCQMVAQLWQVCQGCCGIFLSFNSWASHLTSVPPGDSLRLEITHKLQICFSEGSLHTHTHEILSSGLSFPPLPESLQNLKHNYYTLL